MFDTDDLVLDFDTDAVEPENDYIPIPEGNYDALIQGAEVKPTRDGTGKRLAIRFRITGPSHVGGVIFAGLNVVNRSEKAQEIGRRQLAELLRAVGLPGERDMAKLIDTECRIAVVIRPANGDYPASNDVKRFSPSQTRADAPAGQPGKPGGPAKKAPAFMR